MNDLIKTSEEILAHFEKGEEIPGYKFLQLEIALKVAKQDKSQYCHGVLDGLAEAKEIVTKAFDNA